MIRATIQGLQQVQQANMKLMAAIKPEGALGRAVQYMYMAAHRYVVSITHVDTGALRASHRVEQLGPARYKIYIDPDGLNPISGARTAVYGAVEHARGGSHAFYARTVYEAGPAIRARGIAYLMGNLP
jgi:hypothetical protein